MGVSLVVVFLVSMFIGVPIAVSLGLGAIGAVLISGKYSILAIMHRTINGVDSYVLLAIPFFMLAGNIMNFSGVTSKIFKFAYSLVGHVYGGMAHADIIASMIVSGMSGSGVADASGLGKVIFKAMREKGYDDEFSAAVQSAAATVGPVIPPSVPFVVYAAMAEVSLGALFMGGFIPGILCGGLLMVLIYFMAKKRGYQKADRFSFRYAWESLKEASLPLLAPIIIIGGILTGICTPTEAAVMVTFYALILSFIYKTFSWSELRKALLDTASSSAAIVFIIAASTSFAWVLAMEGIPEKVTAWVLSLTTNPFLIMFIINVVFLVMGMFMESLSILTITVPFLLPLINAIGLDPVYLGMVVVLNLSIGMSTPPVGMCLFVTAKLANVRLEALYKEIIPFLVPLIICLALVTYFPDLSLWLPNLVFGK
ncbi:MAG: transporter large permease [Clostridiales bacterium]|nr:transporter large permease [Clostridiales bacterium]